MGHDTTPDLQLFDFGKQRVRTLPATAERPELFVAQDLCDLGAFADTTDAVRNHVDPEHRVTVDARDVESAGHSLVDHAPESVRTAETPDSDQENPRWVTDPWNESPGRTDSGHLSRERRSRQRRGLRRGPASLVMVTEPGAWALLFAAPSPQAHAMRKWLAADVLPALRRTGVYAVPDVARELADTLAGARAVLDLLGTESAVDTEIANLRDGPGEIDDTAVARAGLLTDALANIDQALARIDASLPTGYTPAVPPQLRELRRRLAERARALPKAMRHEPRALPSDARVVDPWPPVELPSFDERDGW